MEQQIRRIAEIMKLSHNTVVVTGAGISTEAGIPDFRGENGVYRKLGEDRVMEILNIDYFYSHPNQFYQFYWQHFDFQGAEPGKAHFTLADMERKGHIHGIVTQNIDNLHQKAGNKNVFPIHGNAEQFICTNRLCKKIYNRDYIKAQPEVPFCAECSSILKPDVVLFGENIYNYASAWQMIQNAQLLIVIGSSLTVYPLAGFIKSFSTLTQDLVIINKGPTSMDHAALIKIDTGKTGDLLEKVNNLLKA